MSSNPSTPFKPLMPCTTCSQAILSIHSGAATNLAVDSPTYPDMNYFKCSIFNCLECNWSLTAIVNEKTILSFSNKDLHTSVYTNFKKLFHKSLILCAWNSEDASEGVVSLISSNLDLYHAKLNCYILLTLAKSTNTKNMMVILCDNSKY